MDCISALGGGGGDVVGKRKGSKRKQELAYHYRRKVKYAAKYSHVLREIVKENKPFSLALTIRLNLILSKRSLKLKMKQHQKFHNTANAVYVQGRTEMLV